MRIGELAGLVGISTRAVRHYHRVGLLAEPARKANGYRDYSLRDAVGLARVRRLTELGLSLDEVASALAGDASRDLVEILRELDADLAHQEEDLRRRRGRLAQLLQQAEAGGEPSEQAPVSPELAGLFDRMAHVAAGRPGPEPAMAAKDRDLMALLGTAPPARDTGWLDMLTQTLNSDPEAVERAYAVYARLDELAGLPTDDPRVEATAQAIVAAIPEPARRALRFPDGDLEETDEGFAGRQGFEMMKHAFPDLHAHIEDIFAAQDRVAVRLRFRGTHAGEFLGFAATGRIVEYVSHEFYRIADGLIAEEWICSDMATLLGQLG